MTGAVARVTKRLRRRVGLGNRFGSADIPLDELVSPVRYDVLVRQQFLSFLDQHPDMTDDPAALAEASRDQPYYAWFRDIVIGDRTALLEGKTLDEAYAAQVGNAIAVFRRQVSQGTSGILVRRLDEPTRCDSGKLVGPRYIPVDGNHRIALMRLRGDTVLPAGRYVQVSDRHPPRDNTHRLLPFLGLDELAYLAYVGLGYGLASASSTTELREWVAEQQPERLVELDSVLATDLPLVRS